MQVGSGSVVDSLDPEPAVRRSNPRHYKRDFVGFEYREPLLPLRLVGFFILVVTLFFHGLTGRLARYHQHTANAAHTSAVSKIAPDHNIPEKVSGHGLKRASAT